MEEFKRTLKRKLCYKDEMRGNEDLRIVSVGVRWIKQEQALVKCLTHVLAVFSLP